MPGHIFRIFRGFAFKDAVDAFFTLGALIG
jgi:hypothetical protein